jgi:hypothetical protein
LVAEELATALMSKSAFEFKALFDIVHARLRERNAVGGGEEMLRLRAYEKLQSLVHAGVAKKTGKEYRGVPSAVTAFLKAAMEINARFTQAKAAQAAALSPAVRKTAAAEPPKKPAARKKVAKVRSSRASQNGR